MENYEDKRKINHTTIIDSIEVKKNKLFTKVKMEIN